MFCSGYFYVFCDNELWCELEVDESGLMSDVDFLVVWQFFNGMGMVVMQLWIGEGEWLLNLFVFVFLYGCVVISEIWVVYSEVQWDWVYICYLEDDMIVRQVWIIGIDYVWFVVIVDDFVFDWGYFVLKIFYV